MCSETECLWSVRLVSATNIKSSQGFQHSGKCCHEKNNMQPYPRCAANTAAQATHTNTHRTVASGVVQTGSGGRRDRTNRGEGDTAVDTRPLWEQQEQTAARSQYCQTPPRVYSLFTLRTRFNAVKLNLFSRISIMTMMIKMCLIISMWGFRYFICWANQRGTILFI